MADKLYQHNSLRVKRKYFSMNFYGMLLITKYVLLDVPHLTDPQLIGFYNFYYRTNIP